MTVKFRVCVDNLWRSQNELVLYQIGCGEAVFSLISLADPHPRIEYGADSLPRWADRGMYFAFPNDES